MGFFSPGENAIYNEEGSSEEENKVLLMTL